MKLIDRDQPVYPILVYQVTGSRSGLGEISFRVSRFFAIFLLFRVSFRFAAKTFFRFVSFRQGQNLREKRENAPLKMDLQNGNLHYHK